jgi:hypothetical protein
MQDPQHLELGIGDSLDNRPSGAARSCAKRAANSGSAMRCCAASQLENSGTAGTEM